jgi:uncharacterized protein with PQ loop repeat
MSNFNNDTIVYVLSTVSIIFYSIVYVPQFILIYKTQSSAGISIWTLLLWTQADILSLIGTIVLNMHISIVTIGWYHFIIGVLMIFIVIFYNIQNINNFYQCLASFIITILNFITCVLLNIFIDKPYYIIGEAIGWITMSFYLIGRFPQIWLNYNRKSTEGLSVLMYIFTILGNATYIAVITVDPLTIQSNIPWIVTGIISILLDIFILSQHYYYSKSSVSEDSVQDSVLFR